MKNDAIDSTDILFVSRTIKTYLSLYLYQKMYVNVSNVYHFAFSIWAVQNKVI